MTTTTLYNHNSALEQKTQEHKQQAIIKALTDNDRSKIELYHAGMPSKINEYTKNEIIKKFSSRLIGNVLSKAQINKFIKPWNDANGDKAKQSNLIYSLFNRGWIFQNNTQQREQYKNELIRVLTDNGKIDGLLPAISAIQNKKLAEMQGSLKNTPDKGKPILLEKIKEAQANLIMKRPDIIQKIKEKLALHPEIDINCINTINDLVNCYHNGTKKVTAIMVSQGAVDRAEIIPAIKAEMMEVFCSAQLSKAKRQAMSDFLFALENAVDCDDGLAGVIKTLTNCFEALGDLHEQYRSLIIGDTSFIKRLSANLEQRTQERANIFLALKNKTNLEKLSTGEIDTALQQIKTFADNNEKNKDKKLKPWEKMVFHDLEDYKKLREEQAKKKEIKAKIIEMPDNPKTSGCFGFCGLQNFFSNLFNKKSSMKNNVNKPTNALKIN